MIFFGAQHVICATRVTEWSMLRALRLRTKRRGIRRLLTPQERADRYLSRMAISIIAS